MGRVVKFRNFDELLAERQASAPTFQLFEKSYTLAKTLRYDALLALQRLAKRQADEKVSEDDTFATFEAVLGAEILDDLRKHTEFDVEMAAEIVKWALQEYGIAGKDEESPKENPAE